jgi:hypothetical protein
MMRRLCRFHLFVALGTCFVAGCASQPNAAKEGAASGSSATDVPSSQAKQTSVEVYPASSLTAEDGFVDISSVLGQSGQSLADTLSRHRLKERDAASASDPYIPGGETWVYDVGSGVELQLAINHSGEVIHVTLNHTEVLRYPIESAKLMLKRFGIMDLGDPSIAAPAGRQWREVEGAHERIVWANANEIGGYISQVEVMYNDSSTAATRVPSPAPAVSRADSVNLASIIGQPMQSIAGSLSKYGLKERDAAPNDDPDLPGGEIRVYDIGDDLELQLSVTRAGEVIIASVLKDDNADGLKSSLSRNAN